MRLGVLGERGEGEVPTFGGPHAYENTPRCDDAFEAKQDRVRASVADPTLDEPEERYENMKRHPLEIIICRHPYQKRDERHISR